MLLNFGNFLGALNIPSVSLCKKVETAALDDHGVIMIETFVVYNIFYELYGMHINISCIIWKIELMILIEFIFNGHLWSYFGNWTDGTGTFAFYGYNDSGLIENPLFPVTNHYNIVLFFFLREPAGGVGCGCSGMFTPKLYFFIHHQGGVSKPDRDSETDGTWKFTKRGREDRCLRRRRWWQGHSTIV